MKSRSFTPNKKGGADTATSFSSCLRRCEPCGIGASNSRTDRSVVFIYRDAAQDLPPLLRSGWQYPVANAINRRNRKTKLVKFASSNSEDKITWAVFGYLHRSRRLGDLCRSIGLVPASVQGEPTMLLWGSEIDAADELGVAERARLEATCDKLGERRSSRSEPDVALAFGDQALIILEAKHLSPNDKKKITYRGWAGYRAADGFDGGLRGFDAVMATGRYELMRNWRIGVRWSAGRAFTLVNLGPSNLFDVQERKVLDAFELALARKAGAFQIVTWRELLKDEVLETEVESYLRERGLLASE